MTHRITSSGIKFGFLSPREKEKVPEDLFEYIMAEKFHNLGKKLDTQVQETQGVSNEMNPKKFTPRYIKYQ